MRDGDARFTLRMLERRVAQLAERLERVERARLSARREVLREAAGKAALVAREYEWKAQQVKDDSDGSWLSTCASVATHIEAAILALAEECVDAGQLNDVAERKDAAARRMLDAFDHESGDLMGLSKEFYEAEAELRKAFSAEGPKKEDAT